MQEKFILFESSEEDQSWSNMRTQVDRYGITKSFKWCKVSILNLKTQDKRAKDSNNKTDGEPVLVHILTNF